MHRFWYLGMLAGFFTGLSQAQAGVFNITHFLHEGESAAGIEPEVILSNGSGAGLNLKYTYGWGDWSNVQAIIGTGSGPRKFRVGGNWIFDIFPNIEGGQPGIGVALQPLYERREARTQFNTVIQPYVHKVFTSEGGTVVDPFFAVPLGWGFTQGSYKGLMTVVMGALVDGGEQTKYSLELGVNVNNTDTYVSGGITFYP